MDSHVSSGACSYSETRAKDAKQMAAHSFVVVVLIYMSFGEISWMHPSFMDLMIGSDDRI